MESQINSQIVELRQMFQDNAGFDAVIPTVEFDGDAIEITVDHVAFGFADMEDMTFEIEELADCVGADIIAVNVVGTIATFILS